MMPVDSEIGSDASEDDEKLQQLHEETLDVLESEDCSLVLKSCLEAGFTHMEENLFPFFLPDGQGTVVGTVALCLTSHQATHDM